MRIFTSQLPLRHSREGGNPGRLRTSLAALDPGLRGDDGYAFAVSWTSRQRLGEQLVEVVAGGVGECLGVLAAQLGEEAARVGDEGGLAGLAAMGDGGEERGVGLDQQAVEREARGGFLQVLARS